MHPFLSVIILFNLPDGGMRVWFFSLITLSQFTTIINIHTFQYGTSFFTNLQYIRCIYIVQHLTYRNIATGTIIIILTIVYIVNPLNLVYDTLIRRIANAAEAALVEDREAFRFLRELKGSGGPVSGYTTLIIRIPYKKLNLQRLLGQRGGSPPPVPALAAEPGTIIEWKLPAKAISIIYVYDKHRYLYIVADEEQEL